jgi:hypothetical protein
VLRSIRYNNVPRKTPITTSILKLLNKLSAHDLSIESAYAHARKHACGVPLRHAPISTCRCCPQACRNAYTIRRSMRRTCRVLKSCRWPPGRSCSCACRRVCVRLCMRHICILNLCMHACMYARMYVCMHACHSVCMHVCVYVCTRTYTYMHTCTLHTYKLITNIHKLHLLKNTCAYPKQNSDGRVKHGGKRVVCYTENI